MKNRITGAYDERDWWGEVTLDGRTLDPGPSQRVWNHSPDGFAWGYGGSGPAQLALAVLLAAGIPPAQASQLHQEFKWDYVARLPRASFVLEVDVLEWALSKGAAL